MRLPKTLTFTCLLVVGTAVGYTQSAEQQEKALRALRQIIAEKEGRTPTATPAATTTPAPAPVQPAPTTARPPAAQPATTPAAPVETDRERAAREALEQLRSAPQVTQTQPAATPSSLSEERERKARAALDELRRSSGQPAALSTTTPAATPAPTAAPAAPVQAAPVAAPVVVQTPPAQTSAPAATTAALPQDAEARARAALERLRAAEQPEIATATTTTTTTTATTSQPAATTAASAVSSAEMTKKEQLQELLEQYIADQITPREYHDRRARILAGN